MLTITEAAANQIQESARTSDAEGMVLRIAAKTNQDGSIEYGMGFDEAKDSDIRTAQFGAEVVIDPASAELLEEATMDYVELEPGHFRFIFLNPLDPHFVPPKKRKGGDEEQAK